MTVSHDVNRWKWKMVSGEWDLVLDESTAVPCIDTAGFIRSVHSSGRSGPEVNSSTHVVYSDAKSWEWGCNGGAYIVSGQGTDTCIIETLDHKSVTFDVTCKLDGGKTIVTKSYADTRQFGNLKITDIRRKNPMPTNTTDKLVPFAIEVDGYAEDVIITVDGDATLESLTKQDWMWYVTIRTKVKDSKYSITADVSNDSFSDKFVKYVDESVYTS